MFIKKKNIVVVVCSSLVISVVFVSTLIGYSLYIQWKKDSFASKYRNFIYKLTAELFEKNITLSEVSVKIGGNKLFSGIPLLEGSLKNNSSKSITSVQIEVSFQEPGGSVVYKDWFYPLGKQRLDSPALVARLNKAGNVLLPGEGITFRHLLRNCPREIVSEVFTKTEFARQHSKGKIKLGCSVTGLSVS
jgi:uncharacterized membrane protein